MPNEVIEGAVDFLGNSLSEGDRVIFMNVNHRDLNIGKVVKVTKRTVLIDPNPDNTWLYRVRQHHSQVINVSSFTQIK